MLRSNPNSNRANSPMYRGHISVKHPKLYKRKTAMEMQFAVEDIQIPAGIKHEVIEEKQQKTEIKQKQSIEPLELGLNANNNLVFLV